MWSTWEYSAFSLLLEEAEWGQEASERGGPITPRKAGPKASGQENGDAILIGDGACQAVQGCLGFVSQRKGCQEPRKTGSMSRWPCLSVGGGEECWERRPPIPLTLRSTLCQSTASLLGHTPNNQTHRMTQRAGQRELIFEENWFYCVVQWYGFIICTWWRLLIFFFKFIPNAGEWARKPELEEEIKPNKNCATCIFCTHTGNNVTM